MSIEDVGEMIPVKHKAVVVAMPMKKDDERTRQIKN